jgi:hypothetical protein
LSDWLTVIRLAACRLPLDGATVIVMKKRPRDDFAKRELAAFAEAVINLHNHKAFQAPLKTPIHETRNRWSEVFLVANGLVTLRNLAEKELSTLLNRDDGLMALGSSGLRESLAILDALSTGTRHPIFKLTAGIQTESFREKRTEPNRIEKMDIDGILAAVRALITASRLDGEELQESDAIREVIKACRLTPDYFPRRERVHGKDKPPAEQLERQVRDWNRRSKDGRPDGDAATILSEVEKKRGDLPRAAVVLAMARMWGAQTFAIPPSPTTTALSKAP